MRFNEYVDLQTDDRGNEVVYHNDTDTRTEGLVLVFV